ncbi:MAG: pyridoxal 5'-phosphate synthase glutaminase subunit PdxT [candidate division Zixibacteria bacterium]|nr:pyridoxal 5'-phosphate synthase glutaminase subunit PdxT [candidate division Zixibacteria bacterium]
MNIGVLALQGDFERHIHQLSLLGAGMTEVRTATQLNEIDGLIIPGGESTTMNILFDRFDLRQPLTDYGHSRPVWGTCAGMIMLAMKIEDNQANVRTLGLMDVDVVRTGYGRQVNSFDVPLTARLNDDEVTLRATFIRAPRICRTGKNVKTLASYDGDPVLVIEGHLMASSFHTELDDDCTLLEFFLRRFVLARL